ncbi:hypothetical protein MW887_003065 [Aspergillus wentii]|nr:hypothetical protein MW887_003065 [Aspergillus wentii]
MADATEKVYKAWPSGPPTYQQANTDQGRDITQSKHWNYSLFDCCSPGSLCLTACCLPCLTFGKTRARTRDASLQDFHYINTDEEKEAELRTRPELTGYQAPAQMGYS